MPRLWQHTCKECGLTFQRERWTAEYCSPKCRSVFHNRRMKRGAELYDLFMELRFNRGRARVLKLWSVICRMASLWRDEDQAQRDGRNSWHDPKAFLEKNPYLRAK